MRVGIVVGLAAEARIARRLGWRVAIGGGRAEGARAAARRLIDDGCDALVSFGFAGGLDPALRAGALIVASAVIAGDARFPTDPDLSRMLGGAMSQVVAGTDTTVASVGEKRRLRERTSAAAVDLESGAVALSGVPFAVLRAVCDPASRTLPPAALNALDADGTVDIGRLAASLVAHPGQLPALLMLAVDAAAARRALALRVGQIRRARG
jgi:adenosylhomocysteine nucleosidase